MAYTLTQLRLQHPEFNGVVDTFVQSYLDDALLTIDPEVWGPLADQGQRYRACHTMALSPQGQAAKLVDTKGQSTYGVHYDALCQTVSMGFRVAWPA